MYAPLLAVAVLAAAAMLRWRDVADGFEGRLLQVNGREIAPGVTLHFVSDAIGGFPFNVDAVLGDVTIEVNSVRGPLTWHTEHFAIHELTFGRTQEIFEAAGRQKLAWTDTTGAPHQFAFDPGALRASAIAVDGRLVRFDLDLSGIGSPELWGARAQLHLRQSPRHGAIDIAFSADAIHLSPPLRAGLGADIHHLTIAASFAPANGFSPLLSGRDTWQGAVDKWRRHDGTLDLNHIAIDWGTITATGQGRITLDTLHRPEGTLDLQFTGTEHLSATTNAAAPFATALRRLTNAISMTRTRPLSLSVVFNKGSVSLSRRDLTKTSLPAGTLGALY